MITPELTVAAIVEKDNHFLMVEEWVRGAVRFNQPAGHVEPGESLIGAVVRETREESGYLFEPNAMVGSYVWDAADEAPLRIMRTVFTGNCPPQQPRQTLDEGIIAAHWMSLSEIKALGSRLRSPLVLRGIEDYLNERRFPLDTIRCLLPCGTPH